MYPFPRQLFTDPLPNNDRRDTEGFMKYVTELDVGAMIHTRYTKLRDG